MSENIPDYLRVCHQTLKRQKSVDLVMNEMIDKIEKLQRENEELKSRLEIKVESRALEIPQIPSIVVKDEIDTDGVVGLTVCGSPRRSIVPKKEKIEKKTSISSVSIEQKDRLERVSRTLERIRQRSLRLPKKMTADRSVQRIDL